MSGAADRRHLDGPGRDEGSRTLRLAREGGNRVLCLGVGDGTVARALVREADKDVTCVDADDAGLQRLAEHPVRRTIRAGIEDEHWVEEVVGEQFDVVVLTAPLDRLTDPAGLLRRLRERRLLEPRGHLVVRIEAGTAPDDQLARHRELLEAEGFTVTRILRASDTSTLVLRVEPLGADAVQRERDLARLSRRVNRAATQRDQAVRRAAALERQLAELRREEAVPDGPPTEARAGRTRRRARRLLTGLPAAIRRRRGR